MKAKLVGWAGLLTATTLAAHAQLYQQLPLGNHDGFRGDYTRGDGMWTRFADDFRLNTTEVVRFIQWWGGTEFDYPDRFHVRIFADADGVPGAPLVQIDAGDGSPRATTDWVNQGQGIQRIVYSAALPAIDLPGQQRLWLNIENTTDPTWAWEVAAPTSPWGVLRSYNGGPWGDGYGNNASFALFAVPEPNSIALIAFAGAAFFLRRRSR